MKRRRTPGVRLWRTSGPNFFRVCLSPVAPDAARAAVLYVHCVHAAAGGAATFATSAAAMSPSQNQRNAVENEARRAFNGGDFERAAAVALNGFGGEIFGFLVDRLRSESDAADVFSDFVEDLWRGLPAFQWRSTVRVWAYVLARNAANRHVRSPARRASRNLPLSRVPGLAEVVERARTRTRMHLRSEVKSAVARLRENLPPDDQLMLSLRIDKELSWAEIAQVLAGACEDDAKTRARAAARLRQRFKTVKARLRRQAEAAGLLDESDSPET
jgi:RNA polymerase sigma-70 factor, ECF subfamily